MPTTAVTAMKPPQNSRPSMVTPRWRRAGENDKERLLQFIWASIEECTDALEVTEIHPDQEGLADDVFIRHESPEPRIARVVAVVTHHVVVASGHLAGHAFDGVAAVF